MSKLKVVIITQGVSRILNPLLNSKYEIVGVIESAPRGYRARRTIKDQSIDFFYKLLRLGKVLPLDLLLYAKKNNLPYILLTSNNELEVAKWARLISPDLIVVYSMSQLLKPSLFLLPRLGTINLHPALLPSYRGPRPDFWQYYNFDLKIGATVHFIDEGEDTGDIICQDYVNIEPGTKSPALLDIQIGDLGVQLILKALDKLSDNSLQSIKQKIASDTVRARNIADEEHRALIDWSWGVERIWHLLRGTESWFSPIEQPKGLFTGQRWCIGEYIRCDIANLNVGKVKQLSDGYYLICKDGKIRLELKFSIKKLIKGIIKSVK